jgi:hypothetical protein
MAIENVLNGLLVLFLTNIFKILLIYLPMKRKLHTTSLIQQKTEYFYLIISFISRFSVFKKLITLDLGKKEWVADEAAHENAQKTPTTFLSRR